MKDSQKLLQNVYVHDNKLWYQIHSCTKNELIEDTQLIDFMVVDVRENKIHYRDDFIALNKLQDTSIFDILDFLDSLRYKVYKQFEISIKGN